MARLRCTTGRGRSARPPGRQPAASEPDHDEGAALLGRELDSVAFMGPPATGRRTLSMPPLQVGPAAPGSLAPPAQDRAAQSPPSLPAPLPADTALGRQTSAGEIARGAAGSSPLDRLRSAERAISASIGRDVCRAVWASMVLRAATSCPVQRAEVFEIIACILRRTGSLADHDAYPAVAQRLGQDHTPASRAALWRAMESWLPLPEEGELVEPSPTAAAGEVADILLGVPPAELPPFVAAASPLHKEAQFLEVLRHLAALPSPAERSELASALAVGAASPFLAAVASDGAPAAANVAAPGGSPPPDRVKRGAVVAGLASAGRAASPHKRALRSPPPAGPAAKRWSHDRFARSPTRAMSASISSRVDALGPAATEPGAPRPPVVEPEGQGAPQRQPEEARPHQGTATVSRDVGQRQTAAGTTKELQGQLLTAVDADDSIGALAACRLLRLNGSWPSRMNDPMCAHLARSRDASLAVAYCSLFPNGFVPRSPAQGEFMAELLLEDGTFAALQTADGLAMLLENRARLRGPKSGWRLDASWYSRLEVVRELLARREADAGSSAEADRFLASLAS